MMKLLLFTLLLFLLPVAGYPLDVPPLTGRVNDTAGMLSTGTRQQLESELAAFEKAESTQVVLLTVPSLEGEPIEQFGIKVAEAWRIGQQGTDNGAILILSKQDRKVRIEVGRGLEGRLTDLVSGRIIRNEMSPRLKAGDIDGGVTAGLRAIMAAVKGEYTASPRDLRHGKRSAPPVFALLIFALVVCAFLSAISRFLSGAAGAVLVPLAAYLSFATLGVVMLLGLAAAGFGLGMFVADLFGSGGRGRGGGFGGGPWIGGGYGGGFGGGSSGGGFSGGGGSFGGGGASGDW
jgi:uncharacterized protein